MLTVSGPSSTTILHSIGWSGPYAVLHPPGPVAVPSKWRTAAYDGIALRVPPTWPTVNLGSGTTPGVCGHAEFSAPTLIIGPGGPTFCHLSSSVVANIDGVWIRPDNSLFVPPGLPHPPSTIILRPGPATLLVLPPDTSGMNATLAPVLNLLAQNSDGAWVAIDVGLGSNPATARSIIASIRSVPMTSPPPTTSSAYSSCSSDFKIVQTAVEAYEAQMGSYPDGGVTNTAPATTPSLKVGAAPGGTNATALLLTGSNVNGTGKDWRGKPTANKVSPSHDPVGPWLKAAPAKPDQYQIYVSNDGKGTLVVLDARGSVAGPAGGTGGNGASDCNDLP